MRIFSASGVRCECKEVKIEVDYSRALGSTDPRPVLPARSNDDVLRTQELQNGARDTQGKQFKRQSTACEERSRVNHGCPAAVARGRRGDYLRVRAWPPAARYVGDTFQLYTFDARPHHCR